MANTIAFEQHRLINKKQLKELVPYSNSTIARMEKKGQFPQRIKLGANRVAWILSEVMSWIEAKKSASRPSLAPKTGGAL